MIITKNFTYEEIKNSLKEMTNKECLNALVQYGNYERMEADFEQKKYFHEVVKLIKNELLSRMK